MSATKGWDETLAWLLRLSTCCCVSFHEGRGREMVQSPPQPGFGICCSVFYSLHSCKGWLSDLIYMLASCLRLRFNILVCSAEDRCRSRVRESPPSTSRAPTTRRDSSRVWTTCDYAWSLVPENASLLLAWCSLLPWLRWMELGARSWEMENTKKVRFLGVGYL